MQQTWASIDYFPHDCNILILKKYDAENSVEMLLLQANRQFVREHLSEQSKPIIKLRLHSSELITVFMRAIWSKCFKRIIYKILL